MAISSKDLESLWQRYKVEAIPAGISVNQYPSTSPYCPLKNKYNLCCRFKGVAYGK